MIKNLFVINIKALGAHYFKTGRKKASPVKTVLLAFLAVYIFASFFFMFYALFLSLLPFFTVGIGWLYFAFLAFAAFGLSVVTTLFTASAQLFGAKDNELLLSMPVRPSDILLGRILVILAFEYFFTVVIALPAFILWVHGGYANPSGLAFFVIDVLFLPLMAMALSLLLAWLLGLVTSRLRRKNIIVLVLSIGFLSAYFYFAVNIQKYMNDLVNRGEELARAFQRALPPFYAFGKGIADGSVRHWLEFMLWAIAPFTATVILLSLNYRKILTTNRGTVKTVYKEKAVKAGSAFTALVRKELAHYWSKPMVILNSSLGSLFMIGLAIMVIVKRTDVLEYINQLIPMFGNLPPSALGVVILVFLSSANNLSASLISLEGKNIWITKSIPVQLKTVIQSKACTHILISSLPCFIASICMAIVAAESLADWLMLVLVPQAAIILFAVSGLAINLHFPKLDWINETIVVKQGLSAMITLFGVIAVIFGIVFAYAFLLSSIVSLVSFIWLSALLFCIIALLIYAWLVSSGVKI